MSERWDMQVDKSVAIDPQEVRDIQRVGVIERGDMQVDGPAGVSDTEGECD